ncbi:CobQ/CobB/MinD/ParA nucleotide binding domain-containing protein [Bifidobacterium cebidarum]|uniref:CobQ/CobB/MinD/ParA nucleotide binding domain-containing protein n=2 Tax=Bifidobacterium cebidarum TaxID=2650773 RepID=A0A6I1GHK1_9BIFI|nr:CobQ/CobB/MinD/ParA nucleotide binding domain-containing protein [Bifidobacterium cebidarum]
MSTSVKLQNVVTFTSSHSGMGLSTTAAMLARALAGRDRRCALVDADFASGCMDLLLGVERESGLRFNQIVAPLGNVEGEALNDELIAWDGVRVLPYNPWIGLRPTWWEVQAVVRALSSANDVVIVDAGQGELVETVPDLTRSMQIMGVELSVVGLARARTHRARLSTWDCGSPHLIGFAPRGAPRGRGDVSMEEAEGYLLANILGPIRPNTSLCGDVLEGLGIQSVPKINRKAIESLADLVEQTICDRSSVNAEP